MKNKLFMIAALCLSLTACGTAAKPAQQPAEQSTEQTTLAVSVCKATVTAINGTTLIVKPTEGSRESSSASEFSLPLSLLDEGSAATVGMTLEITYDGGIQETYPASFGGIQKVNVLSEPSATLPPPDDNGTLMNDLEYEISTGDYSDSQYKERGYYCDAADGKYRYTICSGERSTGGYGISIAGLDVSDSGTVTVTVKESAPAPDMVVTEAFTYPNCIITFSHEPADGIVIMSPSGTEFERLGNN